METIDAIATILALPVNVACAYYAGKIARRRGRSGRAWIWLGAIFGLFALLIVWLLPAKRKSVDI
jgi:hypothetical protein